MGSASAPALAPIPSSAAPGRTDELEGFVPLYTTKSYGKPPFAPATPQDVWDDLTKNNPHHATQTVSTTEPATNRLGSNAQTYSSRNYEADLARMRADINILLGTKLSEQGINSGRNRLYQRPYPDAYDLVPYPTGWCVLDFIKFSGDDNRSSWEHISQYVAQLGEASFSNSLRVRLFSLSLTGTAFSWFSALPPNSVRSWNELE